MNIKPLVKSEFAEGLRNYAVAQFDAWQHLGADECLDQICQHIESQYPEASLGDVCYAMEAVDPLIDELLFSAGEPSNG